MVQSSVQQKSFKLPDHTPSNEKATGNPPSRQKKAIGDTRAQILADKRHAQQVRAARQTAALRAVASSKVSYLPDADEDQDEEEDALEKALEDELGGVNKSKSKSKGKDKGIGKSGLGYYSTQEAGPAARAGAAAGARGSGKGKKPSDTALSSGSAALDIANAFLSGNLGQQLLHTDSTYQSAGGDKQNIDAKEERRNNNKSYMFDIPMGQVEEADAKDDEDEEDEEEGQEEGKKETDLRYAQYSGKSKYKSCPPLYDSNPNAERRQARGKSGGKGGKGTEGAEYYAENWRSTQGGWVADFGAPHTHTLSMKDDDDSDYD